MGRTPEPPWVWPTEAPTEAPTSAIKRDIDMESFVRTLSAAGVAVVIGLVLYLVLRSRRTAWAKRVFAPRLLTARIPPRVQPRGPLGWLGSLVGPKASKRILEEVGLDAYMANRLLVFCATTFMCLAPFSMFVLLPLYVSESEASAMDINRFTLDAILSGPNKDRQLWIAVSMTYWNSMIVLYLLHHEYRRFVRQRHEFLRRLAPQSYTVLVERIPKQLCNRPALLHYFRKIFGKRVLDAHVVDNNPMLNYAVKKRLQVVSKLERALYQLDRTGERAWRLHVPWLCCWTQIRQKLEPLGVGPIPRPSPAPMVSSSAPSTNLTESLLASGADGGGGVPVGDGSESQAPRAADRSFATRSSSSTCSDSDDDGSHHQGLTDDEETGTPLEGDTAALDDPEERAFLEMWQRNLEMNGLGEATDTQTHQHRDAHQERRGSRCLWLLARANICFYVDAIKSYERELKVWNRRVKHLQNKAERKRKILEREAEKNVVEPSKKVIQDQIRVRIRQERKRRNEAGRGRQGSASSIRLRHRNSNRHVDSPSHASVGGNVVNSVTGEGATRSSIGAGLGRSDSMRSRGSMSSAAIAGGLPWDDGRNAMFQSFLSTTGRPLSRRSTSSAEAADDQSSFFDDEDEDYFTDDMLDGDDDRLFEHAGFDDILRFAVDQNERTSAFITFASLTATMSAAQTVVDRPLRMSISIAPDARDVLWDNLGLPLPVLALFTWLIRAILLAIVLLFGTLTASLSALTKLSSLTHYVPGLKQWLLEHPQFQVVFQEISPLMLVVLYSSVPPLLGLVLRLQRRRSVSEIQLEFFDFYYPFLLIQVFLFYVLVGGVLPHLGEIVNKPLELLSLLGRALPSNVLFFMQYLVTRSVLLVFELLRVPDISLALLRGAFRGSRTARERRTPCCGLHTIDHPHSGMLERVISTVCLCFSIGLTYSVVAPFMTMLALLYFVIATVVYRQQILYVYTSEREGAGILFPKVFRALMTSVLIFQLIMVGIFSVNASPSSVTLMLPLLFATLTFILFCENAYERPSKFLPLGDASELDIIHGPPKHPTLYRHPSSLAPPKLAPEPVNEDSFRLMHQVPSITTMS
ncbi:CSC1-like protein At4g02900 [Durusdinium trenchii]|uniref:CSC1-like protein At4g02900 n=1 Tax=Durusdinium trenchii TaxID=1381693 RepID=A0ABP0IAL7_9DINO